MGPALERLATFLPSFQLRSVVAQGAPQSSPRRLRDASVAFVDVAGFTLATEHFAKQGPQGAELLSGALNAYFGRLIEIVSDWGADVLGFAGDAALLLFEDTNGAGAAATTARAAAAALEVQESLPRLRAAREYNLRARASVGQGHLTHLRVGGVGERWRHIVVGVPFHQAGLANKAAAAGTVVVSPEAWAHLDGAFLATRLDNGHRRLDARISPIPNGCTPRAVPTVSDLGVLRRSVLPVVEERILAGHADWLAQFRRVTVAFVNLPSLDYRRADAIELLQPAVEGFQRALTEFEGCDYDVLVDDKGTTLISAFGLPPLAHEDDAARALAASRALCEEQALALTPTIGVATGRLFCGVYGTAQRQQYTMLGSTMNRAARLMQASGRGVLCDQNTRDAVLARDHAALDFEAHAPLMLKGFEEPVAAFRVHSGSAWGRARKPDSSRRMLFGRTQESAALVGLLDVFAESGRDHPAVLGMIEGEPGIGKSRMLARLEDAARGRGLASTCGFGLSLERNTPYHVWRQVFGAILEFDRASANRSELETEVRARVLAVAPDADELLPLLNPCSASHSSRPR